MLLSQPNKPETTTARSLVAGWRFSVATAIAAVLFLSAGIVSFAQAPPPKKDAPVFKSKYASMRAHDVVQEIAKHYDAPIVALPQVGSRLVKRIEADSLDTAMTQLADSMRTEWWVEGGIYYLGPAREGDLNLLRLRGLKAPLEPLLSGRAVKMGDSLIYRASLEDADALEYAVASISERPTLPIRLVVLSTDDSDQSRAGFDPEIGLAISYVFDWNSLISEANDLLELGFNINTALDLSLQTANAEVEIDTNTLLLSGEDFDIEVTDVFQREVSERTGDTDSPVFRTGFIETKVGLKITLNASYISDEIGWQLSYNVSDADGNQDEENRVASTGVTVLPTHSAMRSIVTLKRTRLQEIENSIPYLRRIPVLGYLFRRKILSRRTRNVAVLIASSGTMPQTIGARTLDPQLLPSRTWSGIEEVKRPDQPGFPELSPRGAMFGSEPFRRKQTAPPPLPPLPSVPGVTPKAGASPNAAAPLPPVGDNPVIGKSDTPDYPAPLNLEVGGSGLAAAGQPPAQPENRTEAAQPSELDVETTSDEALAASLAANPTP